MDHMDELAREVEALLRAGAGDHSVALNAEPWSWAIGDLGHVYLQGSGETAAVVVQAADRNPSSYSVDPADNAAVERAVEDSLRDLGI